MGTTLERTPYAVLGVDPSAPLSVIKSAHRSLSKRLHPDVSPGTESQFRQVQEAYETVGDPDRRAAYDLARTTTAERTAPRGPAAPSSAAHAHRTPTGNSSSSRSPGSAARAESGRVPRWEDYLAAASDRSRRPADTHPASGVPAAGRPGWSWTRYRALPTAARIAWWTPLLTLVLGLSAAAVRYTGATGAWFHAHPGTPLLFGHWTGTPQVGPSTLSLAWRIAAVIVAATVLYAARKTWGPTGTFERAALLLALVVFCGAGEFVLASTPAKLGTAAVGAAYWLWLERLREQAAASARR